MFKYVKDVFRRGFLIILSLAMVGTMYNVNLSAVSEEALSEERMHLLNKEKYLWDLRKFGRNKTKFKIRS